jgi:hypothetical protein
VARRKEVPYGARMTAQPPPGPDPVKVSGAVVEAYGKALLEMGVWDRLAPHLTAEQLKLLQKPPLALTMVESRDVDPIIEAVSRTLGDDAVVELGARAVRSGLMRFLGPMIRGTTQLFGATPASLLSNLGRISSLNVSGVGLRWEDTSERAGRLHLSYPRPTARPNFSIWRGSVGVVFELCNTFGIVGAPQVSADGTACTLEVGWEAPRSPG